MNTEKNNLEEINQKLKQIQKEKQELELLKILLEDKCPKINISDIYVLHKKDIFYIVRKDEDMHKIRSEWTGELVTRYNSTLTDIFTEKEILSRTNSKKPLHNKIRAEDQMTGKIITVTLYPIIEIDRSLLAFLDQNVPLYILQQLYYKLNDIDLTENIHVKTLTNTNKPL